MSGPLPSGLRRNMVTICAMTATIMQALDTTIANVALPYMQGTLSASQDQINWVLTSYIVAAAIMTAPVGWIANRFGRKRIFIICSAGFTAASVLCGLAQDITQMVLFRLLQAQIIAFSQDYQLVMLFVVATILLAIMIGSTKAMLRKQAAGPERAAME